MRKVFRIGPVFVIGPLLLWAMGWNLALHEENQDWYIVWPMLGLLCIVVLWHVALLIAEKNRLAYAVYALLHIPAFYGIWVIARIYATRFPL
jgi:hypothetical protein